MSRMVPVSAASVPVVRPAAVGQRARWTCWLAGLLLASGWLGLSAANAWATTGTYTGGGTDALWSNSANWSGGSVPGAANTDTATFSQALTGTGGTTITLPTGGEILNTLTFSGASTPAFTIGATSGQGALNFTNTSAGSNITLASGLANNQTINEPIVLTVGAQTFSFTNNSTTNSLTVGGAVTSTSTTVGQINFNGAGTQTFSGGINTASGSGVGDKIVFFSGGTSNFTAGTDTFNAGGNYFAVGDGSNATLNFSGATATITNINGQECFIGNNSTGSAVNVSAGSLTLSGFNTTNTVPFIVGGSIKNTTGTTSGTLTISGSGDVEVTSTVNAFILGASQSTHAGVSTGTVNLNGGTLGTAKNITQGNGTANFNFNGGSLKALASSATFMTGLSAATVKSGGAFINANGNSITIGQLLAHDSTLGVTLDGGLTLNGTAGTLILGGANTYTGPTNDNLGTLIVNGTYASTATGAVSVASTATLGGAGTLFGATTFSSGSILAPGVNLSGTSVATLNLAGGLTLGNTTTLNYRLSSSTSSGNDLTAVTGAAAVGTGSTLNITAVSGTLALGTYNLITGTSITGGSNTSSWIIGTHPSGYSLTPGATSTAVTITVSAPITWTGYTNGNGAGFGNWDLSSSTDNNWANGTTVANYNNATNAVQFTDTNPVSGGTNPPGSTVTVNNNYITPMSVTFNNSSVNYTINNAAGVTTGMGGTGILAKSGSANVTLNGQNSYSGGTTISGGMLIANQAAGVPLSSGTVTLSGGTLRLQGSATQAMPLSLGGFNQDVIYAKSEASASAGTLATAFNSDGNILFENGASLTSAPAGSGLPSNTPATRTFTSWQVPTTTFQLQDYTASNAISPTGTILYLKNQGKFSKLAVLSDSAGGAHTFNMVLNFSDGSSTTDTGLNSLDWFNGTSGVALITQGRAGRTSNTYDQGYSATPNPAVNSNAGGNPRLYEQDYTLVAGDAAKTLTSITFSGGAANTEIFGVSGVSTTLPQNYVNNLTVTADSTLDVRTVTNAQMGALSLGANKLSLTGDTGTAYTSGAVTLTAATGGTSTLNPTGGSFTIPTVTGAAASGTNTLALDGTTTGNIITGAIVNGSGGGSVALTKSNTSTWTLGSTSSYTGNTTISAGTLIVNTMSTNALGTGTLLLSGGSLQIKPTGLSNFGVSGTSWTINNANFSSTAITNDVLTLTDNGGSEARSAWFKTPVNVNGNFTTSFVFQAGGSKAADGFTFALQNDSRGLAAIGAAGGAFGYAGTGAITNSAAFELNIFSSGGGGIGIAAGSSGTNPAATAVTPVNPANGDPILVTLTGSGSSSALGVTLQDQTTGALYTGTLNFTSTLSTLLGGNNAYIGFTGATGGSTATQTISNFSYTSSATTVSTGSVSFANNVAISADTTIDVSSVGGATFGTLSIGANKLTATNTSGGGPTLAFGAATLSPTGNSISTLNPTGSIITLPSVTGSATAGNTNTLTLDGTVTGSIITGLIANGAGGGKVAVTKSNTSTWTLSGLNTYTGGTTVSGGKLVSTTATVAPLGYSGLGSGNVTLSGGTLSLQASGTVNVPLALTGFSQKVISAASAASTSVGTTQGYGNVDADILYENGANITGNPSSSSGMPSNTLAGRTFVSLQNASSAFQLQDYTQNTAISPTGTTLALTNSGKFNSLSVLTSTSSGPQTFNMVLNFSSGSPTTVSGLSSPDWFNNTTNVALIANGRANRSTNAYADGYSATPSPANTNGEPRLYEIDYTLSGTDAARTLTSITFNSGVQNTEIFGVSGAPTSLPQVYANNVVVTSSSTIDVRTALSAQMGTLSIGANNLTTTGDTGASLTLGATTLSATAGGNTLFIPTTSSLSLGAVTGSATAGNTNTLDLDGTASGNSIAGAIADGSGSGNVALLKTSTSTWALSAANSYSGGTTVSGGTLQMSGAGTLGSTSGSLTVNTSGLLDLNGTSQNVGNLTGSGGTIVNNGSGAVTLTIGSGDTGGGDYAGVIADNNNAGAGTVALTKTGAGTITLSGANTYSGLTTISGGTLRIGAGSTTGSLGSGSVTDNATLTFNRSDSPVIPNAISGSGTLAQAGAGTLILTGANSYGATTISAGTLQVGNVGAIGSLGTGNVTNNAALVFNRTNTMTVGNAISGTGSVAQSGAGSTVLTNISAYSGVTSVHTGNFTLSGTGALGNTAITVAASASFSAHPGSNFMTAGSTGTTGVGATLTLNPGSSFDMVDSAIGAFNLQQGNGLTPGLTIGSTSGSPVSLTFEIASNVGAGNTLLPTSADRLVVTNDASVRASGGAISIDPVPGAASLTLGDYIIMTASSGLHTSTITLATPTLNVNGHAYGVSLADSTATQEIITISNANPFPHVAYWNGSQSADWSTLNGSGPASNWSTDHTGATDTNQIPGTVTNVFFTIDDSPHGPAQNLTTTLGQNYTINSLNFTGTGTAAVNSVTISGFAITINAAGDGFGNAAGSGITVAAGSDAHTIASNVILGASQTWTNNSTSPLTVSGVISDGGSGYALTTAGSLTLTGVNTYSGGTVINSGALNINADAALGTAPLSAATNLTFAGNGVLQAGGTVSVGATRNIAIGNGVTATFDTNANSLTINSAIGGGNSSSSVNVIGGGTLVLTGTNAYAGGTTVSGATLRAGGAQPFGPSGSTVAVSGGGTLDINGNIFNGFIGSPIYSVSIAGAGVGGNGAIVNSGPSQINALANVTFSADATIGGANTWYVRDGGSGASVTGGGYNLSKTGPNEISFSSASVTGIQNINVNQGLLAFEVGTSVDNSVPGSIIVNTNGTLGVGNFGVAVSIVKPIVMAGGVLETTGLSTLGNATIAAPITLNATGTITPQNLSTLTLNGAISDGSGSNGITMNGLGTLTLAGANSYSGTTTVSSGTVQIGAGSTSGTLGTGPVTDNAALVFNRSDAITQAVAIGGSGTLTQAGNGTVILTASNTYSGATTISAGTLQLGDGATANGSVAGNVVNNSTLAITNATGQTIANVISGSGSVVKSSSATATLTAANSYSGGTTASSGLLIAGNNVSLGSNSLTLNNGAVRVTANGISGFGGAGTGWTVTSNANITSTPINNNVLTLTDNGSTEARTAFFNNPQPVTSGTQGFTASFVYTPSGSKAADGVAFILQNDSRGASALGAAGGSYGYGGTGTITPSAAIELNIFTSQTVGTALGINGSIGPNSAVTPVALGGGDPINVTVAYNPSGSTLTETLQDLTTAQSFSKTYTGVNLATTIGSNMAYVGFGGGTGSSTATQQISNFSYSLGAAGNYANNVVLSAGSNSTLDVGATSGNSTVTMGGLTAAAGGASTLNVTAATAPANQAYALALGATTLHSNVTINVANNGAGTGTLQLGAVSDAGGGYGITKTGLGTLALTTGGSFGGVTVNGGAVAVTHLASTSGNPLGAQPVTLAGGTLTLLRPSNGTPQAATGYNNDVVYAVGEASPSAGTTAGFDGTATTANALYQAGVSGSPGGGLPSSGTFTSNANPAVNFALQPYTTSNSLRLTGNLTSGTLNLSTPTRLSSLNILSATGGGTSAFTFTLHFTDSSSTTVTGSLSSDWFNGSPYAINGIGRVTLSGTFDTGAGTLAAGNPRLYEQDYSLTAADQTKTLSSITFNLLNGSTTTGPIFNVMAISGAVAGVNENLGNAVNVTADSTIDAENAANSTFGQLSIGSNALTVTNLNSSTATYGVIVGSTAFSGNPTLNVSSAGTLTLGAINDGGTARTVTLSGSGTVVLSAPATTVTSGTTFNVNAGTLRSNDLNALGSTGSVNVANGATFSLGATQTIGALGDSGSPIVNGASVLLNGNALTVGGTNNLSSTFSGVIADGSSAGSLVKAGTGTLTLAGSSTYTGGTTLSAGTLRVVNVSGSATGPSTSPVMANGGTLASGAVGTISGAVTASSGANIAPGGIGAIGTLNLGSTLTLADNSILHFDLNGTNDDRLAVAGAVSISSGKPTITFDLVQNLVVGQSYTLATGDFSALTSNSFNYSSVPSGFKVQVDSADIKLVTGNASGQWNVNVSDNYNVSTNWDSGAIPNGVHLVATLGNGVGGLVMPPPSAITITVNGPDTIGTLAFANTQGTQYVLGSDGNSMHGITLDNGGLGATVSVAVNVPVQQVISAGLTFNDNVTFNVTSGTSLLLSSASIAETSGPRNLTLTGGGTLALDATPVSYSGTTTIHGGTLRVSATSNISTSAVTLDASGGANSALRIGNVQNVASLNTVTPAGSGAAMLRVDNGGSLTVGGSSNFTGAVNLQSSSQLNVASGGTLRINALSTPTSSVGTGVMATVNPGATLELAGTTSALADPTALSSSGPAMNPLERVAVQNNGTLQVDDGAAQQVGGIDGSGSVIVSDTTGANPATTLTADHINQTSLVIGAGSVFTLAPSDSNGNPMTATGGLVLAGSLTPSSSFVATSGNLLGALGSTTPTPAVALGGISGAGVNAVPEPASSLLLVLGALSLLSIGVAKRKRSAR